MSGPKVVNIQALRRQQRRECAALLRELTAAVEACLQLQETNVTTAQEMQTRWKTTLAELNGLMTAERWDDLRTRTMAQRDFYRSEAKTLHSRNVERRANLLRREHRLRKTAREMHSELQRLPTSAEREHAIEQLASASDNATLQRALEDAAGVVSAVRRDRAATALSERVRELAAGYIDASAEGDPTPTLTQADRDPDDARIERCLLLLGDLESLEHESIIEPWKQKALLAEEMAGTERTVMLDSLVLELSTHLGKKRAKKAAAIKAEALLAEMENMSSQESAAWRGSLQTALQDQSGHKDLEKLTMSAREWLEKEIQREDAVEQREAVLHALNSLGYEVREGMLTAWTEDGKVVVRKPQESVYGIELSAPAAASAFQVRVVSSGTQGRSRQRDLEVEQIWCGEFAKLQALLAANGFPTQLALAHQPGAVPIKTIADRTTDIDARRNRSGRSQPGRKKE